MQPTDLWPKSARIIEIGATSGVLGNKLLAAGYENFLAVAPNERRCTIIAEQHRPLRRRITTAYSRKVIQQNNAEVLILSGWAALALWRYRSVRHSKYVALKLQLMPLCWIATLLAFVQCAMLRFAPPRIVNLARSGSGPWMLAFRVRKPRPHAGVRRFIPHQAGVCGLLYGLQTAGMRHAVLRWFETLPKVVAGEDLDLLVEDRALDAVRGMLDDGPGIQPVDVYSVTGLPGSDFRAMPYYPPYLADELLDRAAIHRGLCRVPAAREHFLSLAYHALYHKGTDSGIPSERAKKTHSRSSDHDYVTALRQLANGLRLDVPITLEALDKSLDAHGWRPPHDMLIRLSRRNRWVKSLLRQQQKAANADDRLAVFLLREEGLKRGGVPRAQHLIEKHGFRVIETRTFEDRSVPTITRSLRGGNWGRGPWPISGGPPVAAIVAYDPSPITPTRREKKRFPFIANARLLCKDQIRDAFNEGVAADQHCNVIHSSDNGREAMDYLRIIMPERLRDVLDRATGAVQKRAA